MNRENLIQLIEDSKVSEELKNELLTVVGEGEVTEEIIQKVRASLDAAAEAKVEEIANKMVEAAADEFAQDVDKLEQEENQIKQEISKKADEIDLEEVRGQM